MAAAGSSGVLLRSASCDGCWWCSVVVVFILFSVSVFFLYFQICFLYLQIFFLSGCTTLTAR